MDPRQLAAKQKRIAFWQNYLSEVSDSALRAATSEKLTELSQLLARCWSAQVVSSEDEAAIATLERQLESLNETARITVVGRAAAQ